MALDPKVFAYLKPTDDQLQKMAVLRTAADDYVRAVEGLVPDGPDKTYLLRKMREVAMWVNVAITRDANGVPRDV